MTTLSSWVVSIAGICILSVLIDLFLPSGNMSSHIKNIFNFVIILVIIAPLPNIIKNYKNDYTSFITTSDIELQNDFIYQMNRDKLTALKNEIDAKLISKGYQNIEISVYADIFTSNMVIENIYVDLSNLVIENNGQHIDIKKEVEIVILSVLDIDKEAIEFSGW